MTGVITGVIFPEIAHRVWWDGHPGSELRFKEQLPWYLIGVLLLRFFVGLVVFYVREYWPIFFTGSQEEHNGIQR